MIFSLKLKCLNCLADSTYGFRLHLLLHSFYGQYWYLSTYLFRWLFVIQQCDLQILLVNSSLQRSFNKCS